MVCFKIQKLQNIHKISKVGRDPQESLNSIPGLTHDHSKFKPYVWQCYPNTSWTSVGCYDHHPGDPVPGADHPLVKKVISKILNLKTNQNFYLFIYFMEVFSSQTNYDIWNVPIFVRYCSTRNGNSDGNQTK